MQGIAVGLGTIGRLRRQQSAPALVIDDDRLAKRACNAGGNLARDEIIATSRRVADDAYGLVRIFLADSDTSTHSRYAYGNYPRGHSKHRHDVSHRLNLPLLDVTE